MRIPSSRSVKSIAFLLVAGLSAVSGEMRTAMGPRSQAHPSAEAAPVQQARALLASQAPGFGLGSQDDFQLLNTLVNAQGQTVCRFVQTHQGVPVGGTMVVVRVGSAAEITAKRVEVGIQMPAMPVTLDADQALLIAHRDLTPTGAYAAQPTVERILFPSRLIGRVVPKLDEATGRMLPDPLRSVTVGSVSAPHVWGYHVTRKLKDADGRMITLHAVVDGDSGAILRKWRDGQGVDPIAAGLVLPPATDYLGQAERAALPIQVAAEAFPVPQGASPVAAPLVATPAYVPAVGLARTQFLGDVPIPTVYDPGTNGFGLLDLQRGLGGHLYTDLTGYARGNRILSEEVFNVVSTPGGFSVPYYRSFVMDQGPSAHAEVTGSLDNTWGNGQDYFKVSFTQSPFTDSGKTAAGEAMHAVTTTYDLFDKVLGRKSYDGNDTSILVLTNVKYMAGKAMWNPDTQWIEVGWGDTHSWGSVFGEVSTHSGAELTNIAHELGVAMYQTTVPYTYSYSMERSLLERSMGALVAQMAEAYAQRQPGDPANVLPAVPVDWTFGRNRMDGRPWFWLDKPSRDGISPDAYFDGIWMVGQSYFDSFNPGSGPMNRAWYFLAQGASTLPDSDAYSSFLPQGMTGIGLAKTGAIAYKALTDYTTDETGFDGARAACLAAATDLYGAGSPEVLAVTNAFAAINVGPAVGQPAPVRVSFPAGQVEPGTPIAGFFDMEHFMVVPSSDWTPLHIQVDHATDTRVDWKAQGVPGMMGSSGGSTATQGTFNADGAFHAPGKGDGYWSVQAWSRQDPRQFAQGVVWALATDGNGDGDFDALDFADYAMLCYLPYYVKDYLNPYALFGPRTSIADPEIQLVNQAFRNAFKK